MERSEEEEASAPILPRTSPTNDSPNPNPNSSSSFSSLSSSSVMIHSGSSSRWPTIDGPLGLSEQDSVGYARRFFHYGFLLLPALWAVNCFYFWPVLRHSRSFPQIRPYVLRSAIGFAVFTAVLASWALTFAIGGEGLFGHVWDELVMYNVAYKYGLTGWI